MADIENNRKNRLDSMMNLDTLFKALTSGSIIANRLPSNADPTPFRVVVDREAEHGGKANIFLDDKTFPVRFERYRSLDEKNPMLRVIFYDKSENRKVAFEVSTEELILTTTIDPSEESVPKQNLPEGLIEAPGADIVLVNPESIKTLENNKTGHVPAKRFTLIRSEGQEVTLLYRPVRDKYIISNPAQKEERIQTIPDSPIKDLPYLSSVAAAMVVGELDPYIKSGSLFYDKPVSIKPTHCLSKEVANIIVNHLYPLSKNN